MATRRGSLIAASLLVIASVFILAGACDAARKAPAKTAVMTEPPMRVYVVRSAKDGCEPNCPEWIAAQGRIDANSFARFKKVLDELGKRNLPVLIHSGGGRAEEALSIGRLLRRKGVDVAVAKTVLTSCAPGTSACRKQADNKSLRGLPDSERSICASACAFILAAGTRRFVGAGAYVGVHRGEMIQWKLLHTYKVTPYRARDGSVKYKRQLIREKVVGERRTAPSKKIYDGYEKYFAQMGVGKAIMPLLLATPNTSIHWLTREELRATGMATHSLGGEQLVLGAAAPEDGGAAHAVTGIKTPPAGSDCPRFGGSPLACSLQFAPGPFVRRFERAVRAAPINAFTASCISRCPPAAD